ncbi:hypothetical protein IWX50DRAFT_242248 [Phyllosticta citricarpa]|uniref:Uncharacterized protein n=1 Tax=Phyllosticta citricarpa TaxID=55181 RepID=A0ABR1LW89_9PEZI
MVRHDEHWGGKLFVFIESKASRSLILQGTFSYRFVVVVVVVVVFIYLFSSMLQTVRACTTNAPYLRLLSSARENRQRASTTRTVKSNRTRRRHSPHREQAHLQTKQVGTASRPTYAADPPSSNYLGRDTGSDYVTLHHHHTSLSHHLLQKDAAPRACAHRATYLLSDPPACLISSLLSICQRRVGRITQQAGRQASKTKQADRQTDRQVTGISNNVGCEQAQILRYLGTTTTKRLTRSILPWMMRRWVRPSVGTCLSVCLPACLFVHQHDRTTTTNSSSRQPHFKRCCARR